MSFICFLTTDSHNNIKHILSFIHLVSPAQSLVAERGSAATVSASIIIPNKKPLTTKRPSTPTNRYHSRQRKLTDCFGEISDCDADVLEINDLSITIDNIDCNEEVAPPKSKKELTITVENKSATQIPDEIPPNSKPSNFRIPRVSHAAQVGKTDQSNSSNTRSKKTKSNENQRRRKSPKASPDVRYHLERRRAETHRREEKIRQEKRRSEADARRRVKESQQRFEHKEELAEQFWSDVSSGTDRPRISFNQYKQRREQQSHTNSHAVQPGREHAQSQHTAVEHEEYVPVSIHRELGEQPTYIPSSSQQLSQTQDNRARTVSQSPGTSVPQKTHIAVVSEVHQAKGNQHSNHGTKTGFKSANPFARKTAVERTVPLRVAASGVGDKHGNKFVDRIGQRTSSARAATHSSTGSNAIVILRAQRGSPISATTKRKRLGCRQRKALRKALERESQNEPKIESSMKST